MKKNKLNANNDTRITPEELENEHSKVLKSDKYGKEWKLIKKCLKSKKFKKNTNKKVVALKICLIDVTNSTNISRYKNDICLKDLTDIILSIKDFDKRLSKGDPSLVEEISKKTKEKGKNLFSFATKYCCYQNNFIYHRDDYSIYDNVIKKNLWRFDNNAKSNKIKKLINESNYSDFNDIIKNILDKNNIKIKYRRRKFDHFVWFGNKTSKTNKKLSNNNDTNTSSKIDSVLSTNKSSKKSHHPYFEKTEFHSSKTNKWYYFKTRINGTLGVYERDTNREVINWERPSKWAILRQACRDKGILVDEKGKPITNKTSRYKLARLLINKRDTQLNIGS